MNGVFPLRVVGDCDCGGDVDVGGDVGGGASVFGCRVCMYMCGHSVKKG